MSGPGFVQNGPTAVITTGILQPTITGVAQNSALIVKYSVDAINAVIAAPTDSAGQTWIVVSTFANAGGSGCIAWLPVANAGTHTLSFATRAGAQQGGIEEVSGLTGIGGTPVSNSATAATITSPSYTPASASEYVSASMFEAGTTTPDNIHCNTVAFQSIGTLSDSTPKPCTMINQNGTTQSGVEANSAIVTSTTPLTVTWAWTGSIFCFSMVAGFTLSTGGGKTMIGRPGLRLGTPVSRLRSFFRSSSASSITLSLTGQKITASAGTLIAARSLALTGGHITSVSGLIVQTRSLGLTGQAISSHPGSLALSHAQGLTGGRITASAGTVTASTVPVLTLALTGLRITSVAGNLQVAFNLNLTGSRINSASGLLKANLGPALAGVRINSSTGSLGVTRTAVLSGARINSATGTLTNAHTLGLTGARINSSPGSLTASQSFGVTVNLSGLRITASAGSLVSSGGTPSLSGNFSAGFICNVGTLANPDAHL